jgi:hypothetical protein
VGHRSQAHRHPLLTAPRAPNPFAALADNDDEASDAAQPGAAMDVDEYDSSDGEYDDSGGSTGVDDEDDVLHYDTDDDGTVAPSADDDDEDAERAG